MIPLTPDNINTITGNVYNSGARWTIYGITVNTIVIAPEIPLRVYETYTWDGEYYRLTCMNGRSIKYKSFYVLFIEGNTVYSITL